MAVTSECSRHPSLAGTSRSTLILRGEMQLGNARCGRTDTRRSLVASSVEPDHLT